MAEPVPTVRVRWWVVAAIAILGGLLTVVPVLLWLGYEKLRPRVGTQPIPTHLIDGLEPDELRAVLHDRWDLLDRLAWMGGGPAPNRVWSWQLKRSSRKGAQHGQGQGVEGGSREVPQGPREAQGEVASTGSPPVRSGVAVDSVGEAR